jgi:hypothetical protein
MEIAVSRERVLNPESELVALVESLVDDVLARRRHRPQPQLRAMSKRQCATASNLGISSIEAAIRDGSLAAHKVGTRTIIRSEDHELWLANLPRIKPHRSHDDGAAHANV